MRQVELRTARGSDRLSICPRRAAGPLVALTAPYNLSWCACPGRSPGKLPTGEVLFLGIRNKAGWSCRRVQGSQWARSAAWEGSRRREQAGRWLGDRKESHLEHPLLNSINSTSPCYVLC